MSLPAVNHYGPGIWWVEELDLSYEAQQSSGITRNTVVGPAGEMKLTEFTDLMMPLLKNREREMLQPKMCILQWQFEETI